jgi:hypothetical protein
MKTYICIVKKIIFILAVFMLLKPVLPVLEYVVNYEYVSTVLCENKDKPKMHCNGKCHLMKELAKTSEEGKPISSDKKGGTQEHEVLFFQAINAFKIDAIAAITIQQNNKSYSNLYFHLDSKCLFRPPIFIS